MKSFKCFLIVGTRPQIIKSIPLLHEAKQQGMDIQLIHTGQHYDYALSQVFFEELITPQPFANLNVGSGSHIYQIAEIMLKLEKIILTEHPSLIIVPGDTNSAIAGAMASIKLGVPLAHLESGARSYDMKMAEEINRRLIDHCANILFAPTQKCKETLQQEHVRGDIYFAGDTMYDTFINYSAKADENNILDVLGLKEKNYYLLTTHRAENVDNPEKLEKMLTAIQNIDFPVVFPIHPRTKERLKQNGLCLSKSNIKIIEPLGYIEMLAILKHARIAITDSGGLQKEAFWSNTPCVTIRDRTEWTETVDLGVNFVTDIDPDKLLKAINYIETNSNKIDDKFGNKAFGDGNASQKIVSILKNRFEQNTNQY